MSTAILWFRRDLRLTDNPALHSALMEAGRLLPVYIHAPGEESPWPPGAASRWWLEHSLQRLDEALQRLGSRLLVHQGDSLDSLLRLCERHQVKRVYWNRLYDPVTVRRDTRIKARLRALGIDCTTCNANLWFEPWQIKNAQGDPYRVFSAFWRTCIKAGVPNTAPTPSPEQLPGLPASSESLGIQSLGLKPGIPWDKGLRDHWQPGEAGALKRLERFLDQTFDDYADAREMPGEPGTSRLSPHLHFGELGPHQILHGLRSRTSVALRVKNGDGPAVFLRELAWREFAHHLLYHYPHTDTRPLDGRFEHYPWRLGADENGRLQAWQQGRTGIPIVDAGMRELWRTGWMHNRVRMIVASFLTKNLGFHWLEGARWFWDTLVDADLANNTLGWQWSAGCGADAAPFFRIFNPVRQSVRFDPRGVYLRNWLPELAGLPDDSLHAPWEADPRQLHDAGVALGKDYPLPLVDLKASRKQALFEWERIRSVSE